MRPAIRPPTWTRVRAAACASVLLLLAPGGPGRLRAGAAAPAAAPPRDVAALLSAPRSSHGVPGMAAAVVRGDTVVAIGADGARRAGAPEKVTVDDLWHLGSCTKSMTATLCATLVEEGRLRWDETLPEAFPDLAPAMAKGWSAVTLEELLTNRAGAPATLDADGLWGRLWALRGTPPQMRRALVEGVVRHPPDPAPGTRFVYSNAGFSMAGAMAEKVTGKAWEDLMRERLFRPLGITTAGFGAPGVRGRNDEPRGHRADGTPVEPGPGADNPAAIGPAGIVHMSIGDWAKYAALHLEAARGHPRLLRQATFDRLQATPDGSDYAMGWGRPVREWAGGRVLTHAGSNTMWYCVAWIAPEKDLAVLVCCNRGGDEAAKACDEAAWALIRSELRLPAGR